MSLVTTLSVQSVLCQYDCSFDCHAIAMYYCLLSSLGIWILYTAIMVGAIIGKNGKTAQSLDGVYTLLMLEERQEGRRAYFMQAQWKEARQKWIGSVTTLTLRMRSSLNPRTHASSSRYLTHCFSHHSHLSITGTSLLCDGVLVTRSRGP